MLEIRGLTKRFGEADLEAWWVRPLSLLPPFAPMMMPMRVAGDAVPTAEVSARWSSRSWPPPC